MEVIIFKDKAAAEAATAHLLAKRIRHKPKCLLGLATGRTVEAVYAELVRMHKAESLDFSEIKTVNLDEYVGLPADHDQSYRYYMNKHLFSQVNLCPKNCHLPNGMAKNIPTECARYETLIQELGGIEIQLLGIGNTGHIGFNEPGSSLASRTRIKTLTRGTIEQNGPIFGDPALMPRHALTMGVGTIMDAREIVLLATGKGKAQIIAKAVEGPISANITASVLQWHQHAVVIVDEDAASQLEHYDYYKWCYENKPEWQKEI